MVTKVKTPAIYPVIINTDEANLRSFNFYIVNHQDTLFLVDAGYDNEQSWEELQRVLRKNGYTLTDLDAILLTHHHFDHVGLVNRIVSEHSIPVYAHKEAIIRLRRNHSYLQRRIEFFNDLYLRMGCSDTRVAEEMYRLRKYVEKNEKQIVDCEIKTVQEGDELFGFKVLEVFGHSLDHIAFYHEESKKILVGDHMIEHMSSNAIIDVGRDRDRPRSLVMYEKSLKRLLHIPIDIAYSGHGDLIIDPYSLIHKKLKRIKDKGELILQMLHKPKTAASVAEKIYKDRYNALFPLVMSEIIGHIDRLEYYGKVTRSINKGVYYYERSKHHLL